MTDAHSGSPPASAFRVVDDPLQAKLLSDPETLRFFDPFLARERRVAPVARELGERIDTVLYRVRRLRAAGLLRVVREEARAGRPVKVYRSSADAYFVPFAATPYAELRERLAEEAHPQWERAAAGLARLLVRHDSEGRRIYRADDGRVWRDAAAAPGRRLDPDDPRLPAAEWLMDDLRLGRADAREMLHRLRELWREMRGRQPPPGEGEVYQTMFLLLPQDERPLGACDDEEG